MSDQGTPGHPTSRNPILWGAYLACSWTWCIGMFFPAILLRDFGWTGFLIFAIPNVLGAAAMGWVLTSRQASVSMVERHPQAVWWFSTITLAFHVFWIVWISSFIRQSFPLPDNYLIGVGAVAIAFSVVSGRASRFGRMHVLAMLLIVFSIGVLIVTLVTPDTTESRDNLLATEHTATGGLWMIPVCTLGFLLCPYLDVTFHHARQQLDTKANGRVGFTIGFALMFALMIVLTTQYSGLIIAGLNDRLYPTIAALWIGSLLLVHIMCQWIFTVRAHLDQMRTIPGKVPPMSLFFAMLFLAGGLGMLITRAPDHAGLGAGELVYRTFLSAYGLVLPAYVLYRIVLGQVTAKAALTIMWIAIVIATPMYWIGFMERQTIWLGPGVGVLLLGALVARFIPSQTTQSAS